MDFEDFDSADEPEAPSKTQLKKEALAQQELGERLTTLAPEVLQELPLSEALLAAIEEFQRIPPKHGAVKRQLQYIGRLIRACDTEAIEQALQLRSLSAQHTVVQPREKSKIDGYCETLLEQGDSAIQPLLEQHPQLERQKLRQLLRNYHKASAEKQASCRSRLRDYLKSVCH
jgi:ribosome-associated protein